PGPWISCWTKPRRCAMLWEVVIRARGGDPERRRVAEDYDLLTHSGKGESLVAGTVRGYLLQGDLGDEENRRRLADLLVDPVVEDVHVGPLNSAPTGSGARTLTVLLKPGVMDPVAESVLAAAADLSVKLEAVSTFRRYFLAADGADEGALR